MTEGMPAEPIPFRVLLDEAMKLTRRHFGKMYLPVAIPLALLAGLVVVVQHRFLQGVASGEMANPLGAGGCVGFFGVMLFWLALSGLCSAVLTAAAVDGVGGRPIAMKAKWGFVLQPSTLGTLILALIAIFVGLCLLILPGIYMALRMSFLIPVMAAEGLKSTGAMRRSWELVKYNPHKRFLDNTATKIFLLYLVAGLIGWLVSLVVQLPFTAMRGVAAARDVAAAQTGGAASTMTLWLQVPAQMLGQLVSTAVTIYSSFGLVLLYLDVVRRKEGKDLASAIDARFGGASPAPALNPPA
ncbi:MAG: glycerophosphoryl diester phosphodiesterase membrane domain-containing protein [Thermoanaerobaculia bacterium]